MLLGFYTFLMIAASPQPLPGQQKATKSAPGNASASKEETGTAVFYSDKLVGRALASGEKYDKNALTGAHRTLSLGHDGQSYQLEERQKCCRPYQ